MTSCEQLWPYLGLVHFLTGWFLSYSFHIWRLLSACFSPGSFQLKPCNAVHAQHAALRKPTPLMNPDFNCPVEDATEWTGRRWKNHESQWLNAKDMVVNDGSIGIDTDYYWRSNSWLSHESCHEPYFSCRVAMLQWFRHNNFPAAIVDGAAKFKTSPHDCPPWFFPIVQLRGARAEGCHERVILMPLTWWNLGCDGRLLPFFSELSRNWFLPYRSCPKKGAALHYWHRKLGAKGPQHELGLGMVLHLHLLFLAPLQVPVHTHTHEIIQYIIIWYNYTIECNCIV